MSDWDNPSYKKDAKPRTLHYDMLHTLFQLLGYLDNHHGEFLESWMAYLDFRDFPNLIEYYTTINNSTKLQEGNTTIENGTLL